MLLVATLQLSALGLVAAEVGRYSLPAPWSYECDRSNSSYQVTGHVVEAKCVKTPVSAAATVQSLAACKLTCARGGVVWPAPTGPLALGPQLLHFLPQRLQVVAVIAPSQEVSDMVNQFVDVFREYLYMLSPEYEGGYKNPFTETPFLSLGQVQVHIKVEEDDLSLTTDTDESYKVTVEESSAEEAGQSVQVTITAATYYGARHALETLSQMIGYDDLSDTLVTYTRASVEDSPTFAHRGVLLDTSRNFMTKSVIKKIIRGMSYDKLNVFHWHVTDTHSFPLYSRRVPQLTLQGAYSPRQVYTAEDVREIVSYAKLRGVRVLPEFDAPAHVGNGWQFGEREGLGRLAVCVNQEPWQDYCVEPPCGQLNPVNEAVYEVLDKLYQDFFELFDTDMFHMGGDEVNLNCWNTTQEIRDHLEKEGKSGSEEELLELWKNFQNKAASKVYKAAGKKLPLILWTNSLTEKGHVEKYLSNEDYVIQIWTTGEDAVIRELIDKDYKVIFSNYDAWYLDCGYAGWVTDGNNWCSPYKGWQAVYDNSPRQMYRELGGNQDKESLILGGEAAMWSEQVDSAAVVHKLWPRVSALGERLWSDPAAGWKEAETRMVHHRRRLVARDIQADALQPEWCHQNEALCYVRKPVEN